MEKILCTAGFGDDASVFEPLTKINISGPVPLVPMDLPGFGAPRVRGQATSIEALAQVLNDRASALQADTILAHSVASIIASVAATQSGSPIKLILSLEGNLTPEDAYFSGTAAQYTSPEAFRAAFLTRLDQMIPDTPVIARYRAVVEKADPNALWELGCDAHAFSSQHCPGTVLKQAARAVYLFNPDNLPESSLAWLETHDLEREVLPGATHWASVDQPELLLEKIVKAISRSD